MHEAFRAPWFILFNRAFCKALPDVFKKLIAFRAETVFAAVSVTAIKIDHQPGRFDFPIHS